MRQEIAQKDITAANPMTLEQLPLDRAFRLIWDKTEKAETTRYDECRLGNDTLDGDGSKPRLCVELQDERRELG
jgi:hypothetical protein